MISFGEITSLELVGSRAIADDREVRLHPRVGDISLVQNGGAIRIVLDDVDRRRLC